MMRSLLLMVVLVIRVLAIKLESFEKDSVAFDSDASILSKHFK